MEQPLRGSSIRVSNLATAPGFRDYARDYFTEERVTSTLKDIMICVPAALLVTTTIPIAGPALGVMTFATCIPNILGDLLFPDAANKALHQATNLVNPGYAAGFIIGGFAGLGKDTVSAATFGKLLLTASSEFRSYYWEGKAPTIANPDFIYETNKFYEEMYASASKLKIRMTQSDDKSSSRKAEIRELKEPGQYHIEPPRDPWITDNPRETAPPGRDEVIIA